MARLQLKSTEVLNTRQRNSAIDVFRGMAIVGVVLFHFGAWSYGYLGVQLFFVVSGFLVGGLLIDALCAEERISFARFVLSRGCKIWPSYFAFLLLGTAIAHLLYARSHPGELIPWNEWPRYLLFYRNYRGGSHWSFDHIWSLCVEEHYYLILPLVFLFVQHFRQARERLLAAILVSMIAGGILGRIGSHHFHFETYSATHNCLDALAWGTLLRFGLKSGAVRPPQGWRRAWTLIAAAGTICGAVLLHSSGRSPLFNEVYFSAIISPALALAMLGCVDLDMSRARALRFLAYYSYNWYLWHPLLIAFLRDEIGSVPLRFAVYMASSLALAITFTLLVEEPVLARRKRILNRTFGPPVGRSMPASRKLEAV